jgi:hypothetical protein
MMPAAGHISYHVLEIMPRNLVWGVPFSGDSFTCNNPFISQSVTLSVCRRWSSLQAQLLLFEVAGVACQLQVEYTAQLTAAGEAVQAEGITRQLKGHCSIDC